MFIIGSQFAALLLHILFLPLLPGWPSSIICRSTPIDSPVGAIDLACQVHWDGAMTLGNVQYWLWIRYSTPSPPAPHWAGEIDFLPPPPLSSAEDWATVGVQRYRDAGDGLGNGVVHRYSGKSSYHHTKNCTHYRSVLCSHSLFPRFCRSTYLRRSSRLGSIIPSHPLPPVLEPEQPIHTNSLWMPPEVRQCIDDRLSAFYSTISPHHPLVLPPLDCSLVGVCVWPKIVVSEIDCSLMRTRIQVICGSEIAIVNFGPRTSKIHVETINFHLLGWGFWGSWNDCNYSLNIQNH